MTDVVNPIDTQKSEPTKDVADSKKADLETSKKADAPIESSKDEPNSEKAKNK